VHRDDIYLVPAIMTNGAIMLSQNQIPEPNGHIFDFSSSNFFCAECHILSTAGDALT
jgi:hypothetical protein